MEMEKNWQDRIILGITEAAIAGPEHVNICLFYVPFFLKLYMAKTPSKYRKKNIEKCPFPMRTNIPFIFLYQIKL